MPLLLSPSKLLSAVYNLSLLLRLFNVHLYHFGIDSGILYKATSLREERRSEKAKVAIVGLTKAIAQPSRT